MPWYVILFGVLAVLFGIITGVALWRLMRSMSPSQDPSAGEPPQTPGP